MEGSNEWYQGGTSNGQNGEMLRWARVSTSIPIADIPGYANTSNDQVMVMVLTWWYEESSNFVVTLVSSNFRCLNGSRPPCNSQGC